MNVLCLCLREKKKKKKKGKKNREKKKKNKKQQKKPTKTHKQKHKKKKKKKGKKKRRKEEKKEGRKKKRKKKKNIGQSGNKMARFRYYFLLPNVILNHNTPAQREENRIGRCFGCCLAGGQGRQPGALG